MTATLQSSSSWSERLLRLLEQQRRIYHQLHELSCQQSALVAIGAAEELLSLLAGRQGLIDELAQLNERLEPFKREWGARWPQAAQETRKRIGAVIDEVQQLLDRIVQRDEADRAALNTQRGAAAEELTRLGAGVAMNKAYGRGANDGASGAMADHSG